MKILFIRAAAWHINLLSEYVFYFLCRCAFPSVLVIYLTLSLIPIGMLGQPIISVLIVYIIGCCTLISFMDRGALYCSSQNLIESLQNSTIFCEISGTFHIHPLDTLMPALIMLAHLVHEAIVKRTQKTFLAPVMALKTGSVVCTNCFE